MAKALLGYFDWSDPRVVSEMRRLRRRVRNLEAEVARMRDKNDALAAAARHPARPPAR
jgi:cell division protein FtsB